MDAELRWLAMLALLGGCGLSGCAGPVESMAGGSAAIHPRQPLQVAFSPLPDADPQVQARARLAVEQALARQGYTVAADAGTVLLVGIAARDAATGFAGSDGDVLAQVAERRPLQNCRDRTYRLTLVALPVGEGPAGRAWAEEKHCHAGLDEVVPHLAERAVAALGSAQAHGLRHRLGRD